MHLFIIPARDIGAPHSTSFFFSLYSIWSFILAIPPTRLSHDLNLQPGKRPDQLAHVRRSKHKGKCSNSFRLPAQPNFIQLNTKLPCTSSSSFPSSILLFYVLSNKTIFSLSIFFLSPPTIKRHTHPRIKLLGLCAISHHASLRHSASTYILHKFTTLKSTASTAQSSRLRSY